MEDTEFGFMLRRARVAACLSQRELAEAAGLSERAISDLECGHHRRPYPATVRQLGAALGLEGRQFTEFALASRGIGERTAAD